MVSRNSVSDLKTVQINGQRSLIWQPMFNLSHNTAETTKYICSTKDEGAVDHSSVTRRFEKFLTGRKKLNNQANSSRSKSFDFDAVSPSPRDKSGK